MLTPIKNLDKKTKSGMYYSLYKCHCGIEKEILRGNVNRKKKPVTSCGCEKNKKSSDRLRKLVTTHGKSHLPEHSVWKNIKTRCYNKNRKSWKRYGGRGIIVCPEWKDDFEQFYKDMGPRPSLKHSIERKNNNGNYCLENCYWGTSKIQANNTCRNTYVDYNGENKTIAQLSKDTNINRRLLYQRIRQLNWSVEEAILTPVIEGQRQRLITFNGETLKLIEWAKKLNIHPDSLEERLKKWPLEKALTTPVDKTKIYQPILFTHNGKSQTSTIWAREYNISPQTMRQRLYKYGSNFLIELDLKENKK
jgi:hypothetical protein